MNPGFAQRTTAYSKFFAQVCGDGSPVENLSRHGNAHSSPKGAPLEHVRRESRLGRHFSPAEFERAFAGFQQLYHVRPQRVLCSPDVLERFCALFERSPDAGHRRAVRYEGVPLTAAVLPAGMIAFEGEVDEDRMGDW